MRVNIVTEKKENAWILRRMAEELVQLPGVTIDQPEGADAQYYINYALHNESHCGLKIAYFTHLEELGHVRERFIEVMKKCDVPVMMNSRQFSDLWKLLKGSKLKKLCQVIEPGTEFSSNSVTFGVVGRTKETGRKGEHLVDLMVKAGYKVRAFGKGWPCKTYKFDFSFIERFYGVIDYLVVTSLNEGGPIPLLEAIALKVPVIAPDVGLCWDYPVIKYQRGRWDSLNDVLMKLTRPRTWENWREDHRKLFREIECQMTGIG